MNTEPQTLFNNLPNWDDSDLEEQMSKILERDRETLARINMLAPFLNFSEKMAAGLWAYWSIDQSHAQLCDLKPKHGEFATTLKSVVELVGDLSPQAKAEFASDILLEDWEMNLVAGQPVIKAPVPEDDDEDDDDYGLDEEY